MPFKYHLDSSTIKITWVDEVLLEEESLQALFAKNKNIKHIVVDSIPESQKPALISILDAFKSDLEEIPSIIDRLRETATNKSIGDKKSLNIDVFPLEKKALTPEDIFDFMQKSTASFISGLEENENLKSKIVMSIKRNKVVADQILAGFKDHVTSFCEFYYNPLTEEASLQPIPQGKSISVLFYGGLNFWILTTRLRYNDSHFKLNANLISGTNYVVSRDADTAQLKKFIKDTVFNINIKGGIHTILSLSDRSNWRDYKNFASVDSNIKTTFVGTLDGKPERVDEETSTPFKLSLQIKAKKRDEKLDVYVIPISDKTCLDLKDDLIKETVLKIYLASNKEVIAAQCEAGAGRSNALLLTYLLLDDFDAVFYAPTLQLACDKIHEKLQLLRDQVPGAVFTTDQFKDTLVNVVILHDYAVKNNINLTKVKEDKSQLSTQKFDFLQVLEKTNGFMKYDPSKRKVTFKTTKEASDFLSHYSIKKTKIHSVKGVAGKVSCAYVNLSIKKRNLISSAWKMQSESLRVLKL